MAGKKLFESRHAQSVMTGFQTIPSGIVFDRHCGQTLSMSPKLAVWAVVLSVLAAVLSGAGPHAASYSAGHAGGFAGAAAGADMPCDACPQDRKAAPPSGHCLLSCGVVVLAPLAAFTFQPEPGGAYEAERPAAMHPWMRAPELSPPRLSA
jgi:hypothetical protein